MNKNDFLIKRQKLLRTKMKENNIESVLISGIPNVTWLTGFTGDSSIVVMTGGEACFITDFRYVEQAGNETFGVDVIKYKDDIKEEIGKFLEKNKVKSVYFEDLWMSIPDYEEYKKYFKEVSFKPLGNILEYLRMVKDDYELELITNAAKIADMAFEKVLGLIRPGMTELEVAAELEYAMKQNGAISNSFETIVASGVRSSLPHGAASEKVIEMGDCITLDFGAIYKKYCSDMTRTVFLGKPDEKLKEIYLIVKEAQKRALDGIKAGITGKAADTFAREYIASKNYGDCFGHGLGHGTGLLIHEAPRLTSSVKGENILQENMVVSVEPGIYISKLGGVRIEDLVIVKESGLVNMTNSNKDMIIL